MWLRLTEVNSGDVLINFGQARFVERDVGTGSRIIFGDDAAPDSVDYLEVSQSIEEIAKMIENYGSVTISVGGSQSVGDPPG